jgi:hypothetical protein
VQHRSHASSIHDQAPATTRLSHALVVRPVRLEWQGRGTHEAGVQGHHSHKAWESLLFVMKMVTRPRRTVFLAGEMQLPSRFVINKKRRYDRLRSREMSAA